MATDPNTPRSRRAILAAAAGSAAAVAASTVLPASVAAVASPMLTETNNTSGDQTSITDSGDRTIGLQVTSVGTAPGIVGLSTAGVATAPDFPNPGDLGGLTAAAGVYAISVDGTDAAPYAYTSHTGVYGYAPAGDHGSNPLIDATFGTGVWGDSPDAGVYGSGGYGVQGYGGVGVQGYANSAFAGNIGVWAYAPTVSQVALRVTGKASFSRSGRRAVSSGRSSIAISMLGVTSASKVFAVFASSETGRWVRAVVSATGKFTVYFNASLTSSAVVAYFVLD